MHSNLTFQMLLYYHAYFGVLYFILLVPSGIYKILIADISEDPLVIVSLVLTVFNSITELFRLKFGYSGNINESYPDLIAFTIQTLLFSVSFTIAPVFCMFKFPHELSLYIINMCFIVAELVLGIIAMLKFSETGAGAFYRRAAPLIDPKFRKKYEGAEEAGSTREI